MKAPSKGHHSLLRWFAAKCSLRANGVGGWLNHGLRFQAACSEMLPPCEYVGWATKPGFVLSTCRLGGQISEFVVDAAASHGHYDCLDYLLHVSPTILSSWTSQRAAMHSALAGGSMACIARLEEVGCTWEMQYPPGIEGVYKRNPGPLRLDALNAHPCVSWLQWEMTWAARRGDTYTMSVLYECGYEYLRSRHPSWHPAIAAVQHEHVGCLKRDHVGCPKPEHVGCLKLALQHSGLPSRRYQRAIAIFAAQEGEKMLRWVVGRGVKLDRMCAAMAARCGNAPALQWLFDTSPKEVGGLAKAAVCEAAAMANSLECLRIARRRGYRKGDVSPRMAREYDLHSHWLCLSPPQKPWWWEEVGAGLQWDVEMLRYMVQHMETGWARRMLWQVACVVERKLEELEDSVAKGQLEIPANFHMAAQGPDSVHWPVIIFLAKNLKRKLPARIARLAAIRSSRARALAGVVYKAGQLANEGQAHSSLAAWRSMARLPPVLWELIACEADLAIFEHTLPL